MFVFIVCHPSFICNVTLSSINQHLKLDQVKERYAITIDIRVAREKEFRFIYLVICHNLAGLEIVAVEIYSAVINATMHFLLITRNMVVRCR